MSPAAAAPSIASVTAWHTRPHRNDRAAPRSNGMVTPPRISGRPSDEAMQVVADRRRAGASPAGALHGLGNRLGHHQIVRRRDLDVRRLALDQADGVAGALGQGRLVGRLDAGVRRSASAVAQHVAPERLRRLREVDRFARQRLGDVSSGRLRPPPTADGFSRTRPLDGVPRRQRRQRRAGLGGRGNRARDEIGAREGTRRIVNDHHVGSSLTAANALATESCRRGPPATTRSGFGAARS